MGFLKSVKTLGALKGMKKIGTKVGKIIPTSRKVHVEKSLASDKKIDYEYYDNTEDLMSPFLSSNRNGKSSDPESSSVGTFRQILPRRVIDRSVNDIHDETGKKFEPERGESSSIQLTRARDSSTRFVCEMCVKPTHLDNSFSVEGCNHFYCQQCIVDFVRSKVFENVTFIACPKTATGCRGWLEPEYCRSILPDSVFDRWISALHDHYGQFSDAEILSSPGNFICELCSGQVHLEDSFDVKGCNHFYCRQCIVSLVLAKLEDNVTSIMCPEEGCSGVLDPEYCRLILPNELFDWWETALHSQNEQSSNPEINVPSTSNDTSTFVCDICIESFPLGDSFNIKGCSHFYCHQCIVNIVSSKLQDNVSSIKCPEPDCCGVLDPEYCHPILPTDIYDRWGKALCENVIMGSDSTTNYFYCPFADCSVLLIREEQDQNDEVNQSQCPHCKRVVCAMCKVPWHNEFDCDEYQSLRDKGEDEMVRELAKKNKWRKCEKCNYYVEKDEGCMYIKCRCGHAFCYNCGIEKDPDHHTRYCSNCELSDNSGQLIDS